MANKFFVVAGSYEQFRRYKQEKDIIDRVDTSGYAYVLHADMLKGIQDPHGVFIGSWIDRDDIEDIILNLRIATSTATAFNTGVSQAYRQLRERKTS